LADLQEVAAGRPGFPTVDAPCFLCGQAAADPLWTARDRAFAVPGVSTVARCRRCGFLYQKPRVDDAHLADCYPDHYPRHQEPSPRIPFKGSPSRIKAVRRALASTLGYAQFRDGAVGLLTRLQGWRLARKLRWDCTPWTGQGRYLDVGCGSGGALGVAQALGWQVAGIEVDEATGEKARRFTRELHVGDVLTAPFASGRFDVVTAFHVLEHAPDHVAVLRRALAWLAPGGLLIIEVPHAGGLAAAIFGRAWSGLELSRHLSQLSPATLSRAIEQASGRVAWCWHGAKPRYYLWSLGFWLRDRGWPTLARFAERRPVYRVLKLLLEVMLPLARLATRGEVIRIGIRSGQAPNADF
jgi:SAM-dependent methyltransferase